MKMNKNRSLKTYCFLGWSLWAFAGAAIGFLLGGIPLALVELLPGAAAGYLLQKSLIGSVS